VISIILFQFPPSLEYCILG